MKRYLNVRYEDRELAKRLGARWDPSVRRWYCTEGSALAKIFEWRKEAHFQVKTDRVSHKTSPQELSQAKVKKQIHVQQRAKPLHVNHKNRNVTAMTSASFLKSEAFTVPKAQNLELFAAH